MRIAVTTSSFATYDQRPLELLRERGWDVALNPHGRTLTEDEAADVLADCDGVVAGTEPVTARVLDACPRLRVVSRLGAGLDNVDLEAAAARGIAVLNTPDGPTEAVAELTVGLMLSMLRGIPRADAEVRSGTWKKRMGYLLGGKTVGVVGLGRIGSRVATLVRGFGCPVLAADVCPDTERGDACGARFVGLDEVFGAAEIVTLHVPCDPDSRGIVSRERIAQMRPGSFLVNASRGGLVDEDALAEALREGRLAGAAIDTFGREPYDGPLAHLPQVVLSPHVGSYAVETRVGMEAEAVANLIASLEGCEARS